MCPTDQRSISDTSILVSAYQWEEDVLKEVKQERRFDRFVCTIKKKTFIQIRRVLIRSNGFWNPMSIDLIGTSPIDLGDAGKVFPSDHFGLAAVFSINKVPENPK